MERSEYQEFMDCYKMYEDFTRALINTAVIWECLQEQEASGRPYTEAELRTAAQKAAQEAEMRLALAGADIYALTVLSIFEKRYGAKSEQSDEEAAEDGGFSATHFDNST